MTLVSLTSITLFCTLDFLFALGHMIYEMYTGMIQDKVLLENIDLENIPDHEMKDILKYTFGKKLRKKKHPMKVCKNNFYIYFVL